MKRIFFISIFWILLVTIGYAQVDGPKIVLKWNGNDIESGGGEIGVGATATSVIINIKNTGNKTLEIQKITSSGDNAANFVITSGNLASLEPDQEGTFEIVYTPLISKALQTANIAIRSNTPSDFMFKISNKIHPVISWSDPADIPWGTKLSEDQLNATTEVNGDFTYIPDVDAVLQGGKQELKVTFRPEDEATYSNATKIVYINIIPVDIVVEWEAAANIIYGTALSSNQLNAKAYYIEKVEGEEDKKTPVQGTYTYTPNMGEILAVGTHELNADFKPSSSNYAEKNGTKVSITVNKKTPVVTWEKPSNLSFGNPLGNYQFDATADVPGTFAYTPLAGTILEMGNEQELSVLFTPTESENYNTATAKAYINIVEAQVPHLQAHRIILDEVPVYGFEKISGNKFSFTWTRGEGNACVVFVKNTKKEEEEKEEELASPEQGKSYAANSAFAKGDQIGSTGWYCVYDGTDTKLSITGLNQEKDYKVMVLEYNLIGTYKAYLTTASVYNPRIFTTSNSIEGNPTAANIMASNFVSLAKNGKNDTWIVSRIDELTEYELIIFNNLGHVIYTAKPYDNTWDATFEGKQLPAATYYYMFKKDETIIKGFITVVE